MSVMNPYSQYMENQVNTVTPGKLLIMAYDGALRFGRIALEKMREHKLDEQSENIRKMQNILLELMASLDPRVDRQLAANLDGLYTYMFDQLTKASIRDDEAALNEVMQILTELRAAWAEAELQIRSGSAGQGAKAA